MSGAVEIRPSSNVTLSDEDGKSGESGLVKHAGMRSGPWHGYARMDSRAWIEGAGRLGAYSRRECADGLRESRKGVSACADGGLAVGRQRRVITGC